MTSRTILFLSATALGATLVLPAFAANAPIGHGLTSCDGVCAAVLDPLDAAPLVRVSDDHDEDDDDDDHGRRHDDDDDDCEGDEHGWRLFSRGDDDDDDCETPRGQNAPNSMNSGTPPANGLFGNGAAPKAVTN